MQRSANRQPRGDGVAPEPAISLAGSGRGSTPGLGIGTASISAWV